MNMIPLDQYSEITKVLPILCVDIVAQNTIGEYLLIKRANEPKKGHWWVIGGRVFKGETMEGAAIRKVKEETGLQVGNMRPIGYFELVVGENPFGMQFDYHAVSVVFTTIIEDGQTVQLDNQSIEYKFATELPFDFNIRSFETHHQ